MTGRSTIAIIGSIVAVCAIAAAVVTWPWGVRAHRDDMPVVGFLNAQSAAPSIAYVTAFRDGLRETGYVDGRQVRIEYRWTNGDDQKATAMASELAARRVAVIALAGGPRSADAIQSATSTVPALFVAGAAQAQTGLAAAARRPGRNLTGVRLDLTGMAAKRLELLKELMPAGGRIALLVGPGSTTGDRRSLLSHSRRLAMSQGPVLLRIRSPQDFDRELDDALAGAVGAGVRGFIVDPDPFLTRQRASIVALVAKHRLVALYPLRSYVEAGGLASYGPDLVDVYHQIGMYTGQILKGARPGDIPVVSPRKWDLVINRNAAKSLHLDVAPLIVARANEVID